MYRSEGIRDSDTDRNSQEATESELPARLRLLCVGASEPSWVSLTLQLDAQGCVEPTFKWVSTAGEAVALLRDEGYDCLLIRHGPEEVAQSTPDPVGLVRAIRAGGCDDPVVLVVPRAGDADWNAAYEVRAELLVAASGWGSLALVPMLKRAIERVHLVRENHRLAMADHRRLIRERDEADHLLNQQRQIVHELEQLAQTDADGSAVPPCIGLNAMDRVSADSVRGDTRQPPTASPTPPLPRELDDYYQELLRTYVIMGSGNLGAEIARLAELLSVAGLTPRQALELHLVRVEQLVRGLGNRSTRHVMARADLLALELMIHLGERYQRNAMGAAARPQPRSATLFAHSGRLPDGG